MDSVAAETRLVLCRSECPDITPAEFARVFDREWAKVSRNKRVENPVGLLLSPEHGLHTDCAGHLQAIRSTTEQSKEEYAANVSREDFEATIPDESLTETIKQHARRELARIAPAE